MNIKFKRILVKIFDKSIKTGHFFKVMVVLSALFGLVFTVYNFSMVFFREAVIDYVVSASLHDNFYFYKENLLFFMTSERIMYFICSGAGLFILCGCHLLFRGYKWGLLFYTVGKVVQVVTPVIFLGYRAFAVGDVMIVLLFVIYYWSYSFTHNIEKENRRYNQIKDKEDKN